MLLCVIALFNAVMGSQHNIMTFLIFHVLSHMFMLPWEGSLTTQL